MVSYLPARVNNWPFTYLDDHIAGAESYLRCRLHQLKMRPLHPVVVDVIGDLGKKNPLRLQHSIGFFDKTGIEM